jgi:hypothetical protein
MPTELPNYAPQPRPLSAREKIGIGLIVAACVASVTILMWCAHNALMWLDHNYPEPTRIVVYGFAGLSVVVLLWTWFASTRDRTG